MQDGAAGGAAARIGPNSVIQTFDVIRDLIGPEAARAVAERAGCAEWLSAPPGGMVDEARVVRLFQAVEEELAEDAPRVFAAAGRRTADYILKHRIPRFAQVVLRILPPGPAARLLLSAIGQHAWTFAGSGRFSARAGRPIRIRIEANPLARPGSHAFPACFWHKAVFTRLFRALVYRRTLVRETECCSAGAGACVFEIEIG